MTLLMIYILHDLKDPKLWELWYIPCMGHAGFISSTVGRTEAGETCPAVQLELRQCPGSFLHGLRFRVSTLTLAPGRQGSTQGLGFRVWVDRLSTENEDTHEEPNPICTSNILTS